MYFLEAPHCARCLFATFARFETNRAAWETPGLRMDTRYYIGEPHAARCITNDTGLRKPPLKASCFSSNDFSSDTRSKYIFLSNWDILRVISYVFRTDEIAKKKCLKFIKIIAIIESGIRLLFSLINKNNNSKKISEYESRCRNSILSVRKTSFNSNEFSHIRISIKWNIKKSENYF